MALADWLRLPLQRVFDEQQSQQRVLQQVQQLQLQRQQLQQQRQQLLRRVRHYDASLPEHVDAAMRNEADDDDDEATETQERSAMRASAPALLERRRSDAAASTGAGSSSNKRAASASASANGDTRAAGASRPLMELLLAAPRHERGTSTYAHRSTHEVHASAYAIEAVSREHARAHVHTLARGAVSRQWSELVRTLLCAPIELVLERTSDGQTRTYPFGRDVSLLVRDRAHSVSAHAAIICLSSFAHFCCDLAASTASLLVFTPAVNAHLEARLDRVALLTRVLAHVLERVAAELHARARLILETALLKSLSALQVRGRAADMERVRSLVADVRAHARDDVRAYRAPSPQERARLDATLGASPEPPSRAAARWPVAETRPAQHRLSHEPLERSASVPLPPVPASSSGAASPSPPPLLAQSASPSPSPLLAQPASPPPV